MRLEPSHSWTMKAVMDVPSTERTSHTLNTRVQTFIRTDRDQVRSCLITLRDVSYLFPLDDSLT